MFYTILAIFPAIAAFVSLYGLVADASTIDSHLSLAAGIFPAGAVDILHEQITKLAAKSDARLSLGFITGLAVALWSANAGMKAIIDALNVVYDEKEKRSFLKLNLVSLLFTFVALLSLMVALAVIVVAPIVFSALGLAPFLSLAIVVLRWPLLLVFATVALAAIYRYGPSRREARWQWLSVGSAAAALGWLISSVLFSWYIANFGAYNATYGSLGAAVGMMMWMWISAIVILLGGELNAEIEHQTAKDFNRRRRKAAWTAWRRDGRHHRGGEGALADLEHRKGDAIRKPAAGCNEERLREPSMARRGGLETRRAPEINLGRIDGFAAGDPRHDLRRTEADPGVFDVEHASVVEPGDIAGFEPGEAVGADDLIIGAGVQDRPVEPRALNNAANDRHDSPQALGGFPDRDRRADLDRKSATWVKTGVMG